MLKFNPFTATFDFVKGLIKTADIEDGAVTNAKVSAVAAIAASKLNLSIIKPASDSTTALRFQNAAGTTTLLSLDTINNRALVGGAAVGLAGSNTNILLIDPRTTYPGSTNCTAIGSLAGLSSTTGGSWTALGYKAGQNNVTGNSWTAVGVNAGFGASGSTWTAVGVNAGSSAGSGVGWVGVGNFAGQNCAGSNWVAVGINAGVGNSAGNNWTAIGANAGINATGSAAVFIGYQSGQTETRNNVLHIANTSTKSLLTGLFAADCLAIGHTTLNATPTAAADLADSTTARASLRIRAGVAPTSPQEGDIWNDGTNLRLRINGATRTIMLI